MHGEVILVVLILTVGCAAFFFCVFYMACRFLAFVGRRIAAILGGGPADACRAGPPGPQPVQICPREQCRKPEHRSARYCSQCGAPLSNAAEQEALRADRTMF